MKKSMTSALFGLVVPCGVRRKAGPAANVDGDAPSEAYAVTITTTSRHPQAGRASKATRTPLRRRTRTVSALPYRSSNAAHQGRACPRRGPGSLVGDPLRLHS